MKRKFYLLGIVLFVWMGMMAQQPFINEINYFKKKDSLHAPPNNPILFIGSSSFTMWKDVQDYFPDYPILNRGFGGSSLPHLIMYANDIIFPYHPKQIVIYCGENDLSEGSYVTGKLICSRFKQLYKLIRSRLPDVPIVYISMKPSPSREKFLNTMKDGNRRIKKFISHKKNASFIDVYHAMLDDEGKLRSDIYRADNLHMNEKGYRIWQPLIAPYLIK